VAELLRAAGASPVAFDAVAEFLSLCLAGDRHAVQERRAADPDIVARARARRPDAVLAATELGRGAVVRLLVELGFDVHAGHRITPLHQAAYDGNVELAALLLDLGADPTRRDRSFDATPLGWAEHNHQEAAAALPRPHSP
jgi:ankyrin repeat protein